MHERTVREYMRDWQEERHEMLKSVHDGSLVMQLSEDTVNAAMSDEAFIRSRMNDLKTELEEVEDITEKLWDLLDRVDDLMNLKVKDFAKLEKMIEQYLSANATKRVLTTQFLALKKAWDSISGLDSRMKAGETALKAIAQTHARHEAQKAIEKKEATPRPVNGEVIEEGALSVFSQE